MSFLPYTLMNVSYVVTGSLLAPRVEWGRAAALAVVYLLSVGVSAHALDAMGRNKPWGQFLSRGQLLALALSSLSVAVAVGLLYAFAFAPYLLVLGAIELFFLFAYNLELFNAAFHSRGWFALSWGFLPVLAGYVIQTNAISLVALTGGGFGFVTSYVQASASRPYKILKRQKTDPEPNRTTHLERVLKALVGVVLIVTLALALLRVWT